MRIRVLNRILKKIIESETGENFKSISRLIVFGDSLSDTGRWENEGRWILGTFPIPGSSLDSGDGRFADGLVWPDFFALRWAKQIFDEAIQDPAVKEKLWAEFVTGLCDPDDEVDVFHYNIIRNFAQGGSTAATYGIMGLEESAHQSMLSEIERALIEERINTLEVTDLVQIFKESKCALINPEELLISIKDAIKALGARALVINLAIQRHEFLQYEKQLLCNEKKHQKDIKKSTFIAVWAGANDFITVNTTPTKEAADAALKEIIYHIKQLEEHGYQQFAVFNLPDLTKTPFYQKKLQKAEISPEELESIRSLVYDFNARLFDQCQQLQSQLLCFDVESRFEAVYSHPEDYGFDSSKLAKPLSDDPEWVDKPGIEPAKATGAMFWNDVHPTSHLQNIICGQFMDELLQIYQLEAHLNAVNEVGRHCKHGRVSQFFQFLKASFSKFAGCVANGCVLEEEPPEEKLKSSYENIFSKVGAAGSRSEEAIAIEIEEDTLAFIEVTDTASSPTSVPDRLSGECHTESTCQM